MFDWFRSNPVDERATNLAGTCGVCLQPHAIVRTAGGTLVLALHGYKRPYEGYQTKGCFSERREPWEHSKVPAEEWLVKLRFILSNYVESLDRYRSGTVSRLTIQRMRRSPTGGRVHVHGKYVYDDVVIGPEDPEFAGALQTRIHTTKNIIESIQGDIAKLEKRISTWKPGELKVTASGPRWVRAPGAPPFQAVEYAEKKNYSFTGNQIHEIWTGYKFERVTNTEWVNLSESGDAVLWDKDRRKLLLPSGRPAPEGIYPNATQGKILRQIATGSPPVISPRSLKGLVELGLVEVVDGVVVLTDKGHVSVGV